MFLLPAKGSPQFLEDNMFFSSCLHPPASKLIMAGRVSLTISIFSHSSFILFLDLFLLVFFFFSAFKDL